MKKFRLAHHVQVGFYGAGGVFGIGSRQIFINDKDQFESLVKVASVWLEFYSEEEIYRKVHSKYKDLDERVVFSCVSIIKNGFLTTKRNDFNERYSRNRLYSNMMGGVEAENAQDKLLKSKVTLIGCGGIGNHIAHMLASSGIKEITLVDDDSVEPCNLTRQILFREQDCGLKKSEVMARAIHSINSSVDVKKVGMRIRCEQDVAALDRSDLWVVSADTPSELIYWINSCCVKNGQAYINIGYLNDIAVIGPLYIPRKTSCFACASLTPSFSAKSAVLQRAIENINKNYKAPSHASTNGVAACYAFSDIARYLGDFGNILSINRRIGIHTGSLKIEEQVIIPNKVCSVCGKR